MCSKKTKNPQLSSNTLPKIVYMTSIVGIVFTPMAVRIYVREAWMLMVIRFSIFSLIKNDDIRTYPIAPNARTTVHKATERPQFIPNLHKDPIVTPTNPCISRYVDAFTGPDKMSNNIAVATMVFLPAASPHLIEEITIGNEKKQPK